MSMANNFKWEEGVGESIKISMWSAVLFVREERLRLECNSRVTVSKWEAREGNVTWKVKIFHIAEYCTLYEYFYTWKESSLLDHLPDK